MKRINLILAMDDKNGIGKDGDLAWRLKEDMEYFKNITIGDGKNSVIMGRKTWDSIPEKYRPLPNRDNYVLTRHKFLKIKGASTINNLSEIKDIEGELFIIGGAEIYNLCLRQYSRFIDKIYLTRVKGDFNCDTSLVLNLSELDLINKGISQTNKKGIEFIFEIYKLKQK